MERILVIFAVLSCGILLYPYPATVFLSVCLALLSFPIYERMKNKYSAFRAMLIYVVSIVFSVAIPVTIVISMLAPQVINGVVLLQKWRQAGWPIPEYILKYFDRFEAWLVSIPELNTFVDSINSNMEETINSVIAYVLTNSAGIARNIATNIMSYFWFLFVFVVLATMGVMYAKQIKRLSLAFLKIETAMLDRYINAIRGALRSVVMGILLVALLQGIACTIGFMIFQVPEPLFWGLLACLVAPIPFIGTALIWVPLTFVLWLTGNPFMALGLAAWGMLVVAAVDNFMRPYLLSRGIEAPFFVLLLSILTGLAVFGATGLIVGPVLLAFSLQCIRESFYILEDDAVMHEINKEEEKKNNI